MSATTLRYLIIFALIALWVIVSYGLARLFAEVLCWLVL